MQSVKKVNNTYVVASFFQDLLGISISERQDSAPSSNLDFYVVRLTLKD